jgi:hypothetical protein
MAALVPLDRHQSGDWGEVSPEDAIAQSVRTAHPTESERQRRRDRVERHPEETRQPLTDLVGMRQSTVGC